MNDDAIERCKREIAAIEVEMLAGNPDVTGLVLALFDWNAELRILEQSKTRRAGGMNILKRLEQLEEELFRRR